MSPIVSPKKIAVLYGGFSAEREVSLVSGDGCAAALERLGHQVARIDVTPDIGGLVQRLIDLKPDVVFNALHGRFGEDGCVQGLLNLLKIPYTHSGVMASALAMDKPMAIRLFRQAGLPCADSVVVRLADLVDGVDPLPRPFVLKPTNEGSSVGVHILQIGDNRSLGEVLGADWPPDALIMVEAYIPGREVQVAVMGEQALGIIELRPKRLFYDYTAKYTAGVTEHLMPAPVPAAIAEQAMEIALAAHRVLGCRGVSRSDFRYNPETEQVILLELNNQPGMTPLSLTPEIAAYRGITYEALVQWLVDHAQTD
jgi:D-alanine-D-alanine ligase